MSKLCVFYSELHSVYVHHTNVTAFCNNASSACGQDARTTGEMGNRRSVFGEHYLLPITHYLITHYPLPG